MRNRYLYVTSCLLAFTALYLPTAALSATFPSDDPEQSTQLSEVVVTALKRETSLRDTPAAITVLNGDDLRQQNIDGINDLQRLAPSLVVTDAGPGQRRITLRGIRASGDALVGVYYDEAPLTAPPGSTTDAGGAQSDLKLFDIDRIEVLRGPQGTLYGAGSVGGALRIIFKKPELDAYEGVVDVTGTTTAHGGEGYQLNAAVNLPLIRDVLGARIVGYSRQDDGWIDNPGLNLKGINAEDTTGGRLLLRFKPDERLTIDASAFYQKTESQPGTWSPSVGEYQSANLAVLPIEDENRLYSLTARSDLGFATLTATTSYQDRDQLVTRDPTYLWRALGGSAYPAGIYYQPQSVTSWTGEVRLQSNGDGRLGWTLGGYYEDRDARVLSEAHQVGSDGYDLDPAVVLLQRHVWDSLKQKAVFGELSYKVTDRLTLTGGLRYYEYDKTVAGDTTIGFPLLYTKSAAYAEYDSSSDGWLYRANASYKINDNVLVYAQAATGYRPGGVNQVLGLAEALAYLPDELASYEAGAKVSLADGRVQLNLAAYQSNWDNLQVSLTTSSFAYLGNAGAARIKGLEAEVVTYPVEGLVVSGNLNLISAKLTKDLIASDAIASTSTGRAGDRIQNIPEVTATISAEYEWPVSASLTGVVRGDANYVGRSYSAFRPEGSGYYPIGDYTAVNARVGVRTDRWGAYLFASNLFDEVGLTSSGNVLGGSIEAVTSIAPRTVGINLTANF